MNAVDRYQSANRFKIKKSERDLKKKYLLLIAQSH